MKLLTHRRRDDGYLLQIWLDEERVVGEEDPRVEELGLVPGDPDPDWVREYRFGLDPPETGKLAGDDFDPDVHGEDPPMRGQTREEWEEATVENAAALAREELARMTAAEPAPSAGRKVSSEGQTLTPD